MVRNAKIGEYVQVIDRYTEEPLTKGSQSVSDNSGTITGMWDYSLGNTGTIVDISYFPRASGYKIRIVIEPDPPNFGKFVWFTPKQLRRISKR